MPMKQFPELKPRLWDAVVVLAVALLAVFCAVRTWGGETEGLTAVVAIDGQVTERFALDGAGEHTYTYNGYTLRFEEREGGICAAESDCPTQDCVHTGLVSRGGQSIVCLPARISVTLEGGGTAVDTVIG